MNLEEYEFISKEEILTSLRLDEFNITNNSLDLSKIGLGHYLIDYKNDNERLKVFIKSGEDEKNLSLHFSDLGRHIPHLRSYGEKEFEINAVVQVLDSKGIPLNSNLLTAPSGRYKINLVGFLVK